jgi:hypothetical protein
VNRFPLPETGFRASRYSEAIDWLGEGTEGGAGAEPEGGAGAEPEGGAGAESGVGLGGALLAAVAEAELRAACAELLVLPPPQAETMKAVVQATARARIIARLLLRVIIRQ